MLEIELFLMRTFAEGIRRYRYYTKKYNFKKLFLYLNIQINRLMLYKKFRPVYVY